MTALAYHRKIIDIRRTAQQDIVVWFSDGQVIVIPGGEVPNLDWKEGETIKFTLSRPDHEPPLLEATVTALPHPVASSA